MDTKQNKEVFIPMDDLKMMVYYSNDGKEHFEINSLSNLQNKAAKLGMTFLHHKGEDKISLYDEKHPEGAMVVEYYTIH